MAKFLVMRQHIGDKDYFEGDIREANPADVKHLVANGVLVDEVEQIEDEKADTSQRTKLERTPLNKAEKRAPENK